MTKNSQKWLISEILPHPVVYEPFCVLKSPESWKPVLAAEEIFYDVVAVLETYHFLVLNLMSEHAHDCEAIRRHLIGAYRFR